MFVDNMIRTRGNTDILNEGGISVQLTVWQRKLSAAINQTDVL